MKAEKSLRARALDLLSRGEYSRLQLTQKLAKHSEDEAEISALLDDLAERGWQSDERYAEVLIHSKSQRLGNRRLQQGPHPEERPGKNGFSRIGAMDLCTDATGFFQG